MRARVFGSEGPLQEVDGTVGSLHLKPWSYGSEPFRDVRRSLMRGDEPLIAGKVAHSGLAVSVALIYGLVDGSGAGCQSLLIHRVSVFHIQMEARWIWLFDLSFSASAQHQHGIADVGLDVVASGGTNAAG